MDLMRLMLSGLVISAAVFVALGLVLFLVKRGQMEDDPKPHFLPSTAFTFAAAIGAITLGALFIGANYVGDWGIYPLFWDGLTAFVGSGLGAVSSLFGIEVLPKWQWVGQFAVSAIVFVCLGCFLTIAMF
jgi:hypothetical protein